MNLSLNYCIHLITQVRLRLHIVPIIKSFTTILIKTEIETKFALEFLSKFFISKYFKNKRYILLFCSLIFGVRIP